MKSSTELSDNLLKDFKSSKYQESYLRLANDRNIFLCEDVTKEVAATISALLIYYDNIDTTKDINIYINSNGGDADSLINMYDIMQVIKSPIKTICIGKAYSAGAVLLAAGTKGKRVAFQNSEVMLHQLQCSFPIIGKTEAASSDIYLKFLNKYNDKILKILSKHTGYSLSKIKTDSARDLFFSAEEALNYNLIDEII